MTPADKAKFVAVLEGLAAMKPGARLTPASFELYWNALCADWTLEAFTAAASHLACSFEFMPNPYHFEQLRKAGRRTAGEAWIIARDAWRHGLSSCGDPLIDRVVAMLGGYDTMGQTRTDQLQFIERRFCDHYAELQDVGDVRAAVPQIAPTPSTRIAADNVRKLATIAGRLRT